MKRMVCTCDLCGREVNFGNKNIYHIKVKSTSYVNYANYDMWGADKKIIDICSNCIEDIKNFIKLKHKTMKTTIPDTRTKEND